MKNLFVLLLISVSLVSCKKDTPTPGTYEVKVIASSTSYTLKLQEQHGGTVYINETAGAGTKTFTVNPPASEELSLTYTTTTGINIKLYINGVLTEYNKPNGSGGITVHI